MRRFIQIARLSLALRLAVSACVIRGPETTDTAPPKVAPAAVKGAVKGPEKGASAAVRGADPGRQDRGERQGARHHRRVFGLRLSVLQAGAHDGGGAARAIRRQGATGRLREPLPFHTTAAPAAKWAFAAGEQGRYWQARDTLFEHQKTLDEAALAAMAHASGLDAERLDRDRRSMAAENHVKGSLDVAASGRDRDSHLLRQRARSSVRSRWTRSARRFDAAIEGRSGDCRARRPPGGRLCRGAEDRRAPVPEGSRQRRRREGRREAVRRRGRLRLQGQGRRRRGSGRGAGRHRFLATPLSAARRTPLSRWRCSPISSALIAARRRRPCARWRRPIPASCASRTSRRPSRSTSTRGSRRRRPWRPSGKGVLRVPRRRLRAPGRPRSRGAPRVRGGLGLDMTRFPPI